MKTPHPNIILAALCIGAAIPANAQTPPGYQPSAAPSAPLLNASQLQDLVGRVALYPDDLLALILPASTTPLDIVKAQRFLTKYAVDKTLKPDPSLSQPVMNLLTYPDVVNLMGDDLDWTEALGQAVTTQQQDVLNAIQVFRRKAQAAGNLNSDDKQTIIVQQETVQIVPAKPEVIYVPVYQPATVVVVQPAPAVTYVPTAYPVYYNPAATAAVAATVGYIAGANTAYGVNWYGGGCYAAPYANYANHIQDERMNYANNAREDWQNYGSASREDWQNHANQSQTQRQNAAVSNQASRQQTSTANQSQRQDAAAGAQASSQQSQAARQSTAQQNQAARQAAAPQGAQSWQGAAGSGQYTGSGQAAAANRAASTSQFGSRQTTRTSAGAYGGASSGARAQSYGDRGSRSMSGASRSGGGGGGSGGGGGRGRR
jgi:hypothetical protein